MSQGPNEGTEYQLEGAAILGRLPTNAIPVQDAKASREHAKIYKQGQQFAIVDLNSSNGTFVNGQKITKQILSEGDEISIGLVTLRFELLEEEKPKRQAPQRKSADEAFAAAKEDKGKGETAAPAGGTPEIALRNFQPIQYNRVKPGRTWNFDISQMSDGTRFIIYGIGILLFAGIVYLFATM